MAGEFEGGEVRGQGKGVGGKRGEGDALEGDGRDGGGDGGDVLGVGVLT